MAKSYTKEDVLRDLSKRVSASSQAAVAESLGCSRPFLNDVIHGRRELTVNLANAMGYIKMPDKYVKGEA